MLIVEVEVEGLIQKAGFLIHRRSETGSSSLDLSYDKTVAPKRCNLCIPWNLFHQMLLRYVRVETQKLTRKIDVSISR